MNVLQNSIFHFPNQAFWNNAPDKQKVESLKNARECCAFVRKPLNFRIFLLISLFFRQTNVPKAFKFIVDSAGRKL